MHYERLALNEILWMTHYGGGKLQKSNKQGCKTKENSLSLLGDCGQGQLRNPEILHLQFSNSSNILLSFEYSNSFYITSSYILILPNEMVN